MLTINGIDIPIWWYKDTVIRYTHIQEKSGEGIELRNQVRDQEGSYWEVIRRSYEEQLTYEECGKRLDQHSNILFCRNQSLSAEELSDYEKMFIVNPNSPLVQYCLNKIVEDLNSILKVVNTGNKLLGSDYIDKLWHQYRLRVSRLNLEYTQDGEVRIPKNYKVNTADEYFRRYYNAELKRRKYNNLPLENKG